MTLVFIDDDADDTAIFCEAVLDLLQSDNGKNQKEIIHCVQINDSLKAVHTILTMETVPDYIFIDINMPMVSGRECLMHLKSNARFSQVPVIMLSTTIREQDALELVNMGAVECLAKPHSYNDLKDMFTKYIYTKQ
jgi:CheY-like chemotaxis protein